MSSPNVRAMMAVATPTAVAVLRWPSQASVLARARCRNCGARVLVSDEPTAGNPRTDLHCLTCSRRLCELRIDGWRPALTPAQFHALPIQQGKRNGIPHQRMIPCPVCGSHEIAAHRARCQDCESRRRALGSLPFRLVALLESLGHLRMTDICAELEASPDSIRQAIKKARMNGHVVALDQAKYRYEHGARVTVSPAVYRLEVGL